MVKEKFDWVKEGKTLRWEAGSGGESVGRRCVCVCGSTVVASRRVVENLNLLYFPPQIVPSSCFGTTSNSLQSYCL